MNYFKRIGLCAGGPVVHTGQNTELTFPYISTNRDITAGPNIWSSGSQLDPGETHTIRPIRIQRGVQDLS